MRITQSYANDLLGKLLAMENISIVYDPLASGPYFNLDSRTLVFPPWTDVSKNLKDLIIGHEVGHALYTPRAKWLSTIQRWKGNKEFFQHCLNLVEDARIERMIKEQYPGLKRPMFIGYGELVERGFFGVGEDLLKNPFLPVTDRLNIHFKLGSRMPQTFSADELSLVEAIEKVVSFDEVVKVAKKLAVVAEKEAKDYADLDALLERMMAENPQQGVSGQFKQKLAAERIVEALKKAMQDGVPSISQDPMQRFYDATTDSDSTKQHKSGQFVYGKVGRFDLNQFVVDAGVYHELMRKHFKGLSHELKQNYQVFLNSHETYVKHLVREFEVRRNARSLDRSRFAKTGELNTDKLWKASLTDDLFLQQTIIPHQKNHGMIMVMDMSGSMMNMMRETIQQTVCLAMFCRKTNIPFEVYTFLDSARYDEEVRLMRQKGKKAYFKHYKDGGSELIWDSTLQTHVVPQDAGFRMQQVLTSDMSNVAFVEAVTHLLALAEAMYKVKHRTLFTAFDIPQHASLGSTPLVETSLLLFSIAEQFQKRHRIDKLNTIILTDGDPSSCLYVKAGDAVNCMTSSQSGVLFDTITKKEISIDGRDHIHPYYSLLELYRASTNSQVLGFFVTPCHQGYREKIEEMATRIDCEDIERRDSFTKLKLRGFDHFFIMALGDEAANQDLNRLEQEIYRYQNYVRRSPKRSTAHQKALADYVQTYFQAMQAKKVVSKSFINLFVRSLS